MSDKKKAIVVLLCFALSVAFIWVLATKPFDFQLSPIEKCQRAVVSIGDDYLDFEITAAEAILWLDAIRVPETAGTGQDYLETNIYTLLRLLKDEYSTYNEIEEEVDWIRHHDYEK